MYGYQMLNYAISGNPMECDMKYFFPELSDLMQKTHTKVMQNQPGMLAELHGLIAKYPKVPAFRNYLSTLYANTGRMNKAYETNRQIVVDFPDYVQAVSILANEYMDAGEFEKAKEVLGPSLEIKSRFPDRQVFHFGEFEPFMIAATQCAIYLGDLEGARMRIQVLEQAGQGGFFVRHLALVKEQLSMAETIMSALENDNGEPLYRPSSGTEEAPDFHHPQVKSLYEHGLNLPRSLWDEVLALPRETLLEDLKTILRDAVARHEDVNWMLEEGIVGEDYTDAVVLAMLFLQELRAVEALPEVLNVLRQDEDVTDLWLGDHETETMWQVLYYIGKDQLDVLLDFAKDDSVATFSRASVLETMEYLDMNEPHRREALTEWMRQLLLHLIEVADDEKRCDPVFNETAIDAAVHMRMAEFLPLIQTLHKKNAVDSSFGATFKNVSKEIKSPKIPSHLPLYENAWEYIQHVLAHWYGYASDDSKNDGPQNNVFRAIQHSSPEDLPKPKPKATITYTNLKPDTSVGRNDPCPCGSGKKYKKCCWGK